MKTRRGFTLSELAIALSITAGIALLAVGLLNMSTKASLLTRSASQAIVNEITLTDELKTTVQTATDIYTLPEGNFKQEHLTSGWNYVGLMDISEFGGSLPDHVVEKVGLTESTPITDSFELEDGTVVDAGHVLVHIEFAGETEPEVPEDGVIMQATDVTGGNYYYIVHVLGYDYYSFTEQKRHVYSFKVEEASQSKDLNGEGLNIEITDTVYNSKQVAQADGTEKTVWHNGQTNIHVTNFIPTDNASVFKDFAAGSGVAIAYELPKTVVDPYQKKNGQFTVAILMDTSSFRDDNDYVRYMNRMSDTMSNGITRFDNMKTSVNNLLAELSKYPNGNVILIPFSYVGAAAGNFESLERPDPSVASLTFSTAGDLEKSRDLVRSLKLAGGSNPGDAVRVLYNELCKIENEGGSVGPLSVVMYTGREMGSWSTWTGVSESRGNKNNQNIYAMNTGIGYFSGLGASYYTADKTRTGYDPVAETYPAYVRTNYYYWENGYFDAQFWYVESSTWTAAGWKLGDYYWAGIDEYDKNNTVRITADGDTDTRSRYRGTTDTYKVHNHRQDQLGKARSFLKEQVRLLKRDFEFATYKNEVNGEHVQTENLFLVALWDINNKSNEKQAYLDAGFTVYANYTSLPSAAIENIVDSISGLNTPNGL